ncbi:MAG: hypothetical protein R3F30_00370 [Planctomycetota bacterium]
MQRRGRPTRGLAHALGGAAGRRGERDLLVVLGGEVAERGQDRGLADAGAPGDDREGLAQRQQQGEALALGEPQAAAPGPGLEPARRVAPGLALGPRDEGLDGPGEADLGHVHRQRIDPLLEAVDEDRQAGRPLDDDPPRARQGLERLVEGGLGQARQLGRAAQQVGARQAGAALAVDGPGQDVEQAGLAPLERLGGDAELAGDLVGPLEADADELLGQAVGVGLEHPRRLGAPGRQDALGQPRRQAVAVQEQQDLAQVALLGQGPTDLGGLLAADAGDLEQAGGVLLEQLEGGLAEVVDDPLGQGRPDPVDEARRQVGQDRGSALRPGDRDRLDADLLAEARVDLDVAAELEQLAGTEVPDRPADRDPVPGLRQLEAGGAEARFGVAEPVPDQGPRELDGLPLGEPRGVEVHARGPSRSHRKSTAPVARQPRSGKVLSPCTPGSRVGVSPAHRKGRPRSPVSA